MFKKIIKKLNKIYFLYVYIMKNTIVRLVFTVFLMWLTIQIDPTYENYIAYFLIFTVGILHGANDISLISYLSKDSTTNTWKLLMFYVFVIISMSFAFYLFPLVALLIFIAFSCYHFGEQHLIDKLLIKKSNHSLFFISYGALILSLVFYVNLEDTTLVIFELTEVIIPKLYFLVFLILSSVSTLLLLILERNNFKKEVNLLEELFLLCLFFIIFKLASLIWAFAIYFIVWHSLPSLEDQITTLYTSFNKKNLIKYFKSSLLNWLISLFGLIVLYIASNYLEVRFITLFFAFLAAITIPHVIVMYYLNNKDKV